MEWAHCAEPLMVARRERPALEFAGGILKKRSKKISKRIEDIEALDTRRRHKARIAVKKLRYACEFFTGLFDGPKQISKRRRFASFLKSLQGSLGTLNDIEKAMTMGFIAGQEQQQIASCITAAEKTADQLSNSTKFWKR
jgi:CHAD domain-containing protein